MSGAAACAREFFWFHQKGFSSPTLFAPYYNRLTAYTSLPLELELLPFPCSCMLVSQTFSLLLSRIKAQEYE